MTKELYFETFEEQERKFEEVWKAYPLVMKPTIYHWWFYRYLQISPSYLKQCLISEWAWNIHIHKKEDAASAFSNRRQGICGIRGVLVNEKHTRIITG